MMLVRNWKKSYAWLTTHMSLALVGFGFLNPEHQVAILTWLGVPLLQLPAAIGATYWLLRMINQSPPDPK